MRSVVIVGKHPIDYDVQMWIQASLVVNNVARHCLAISTFANKTATVEIVLLVMCKKSNFAIVEKLKNIAHVDLVSKTC